MVSLITAIYGVRVTEALCASCKWRPVDPSGTFAIFCVGCAERCEAVWDSGLVDFDEGLELAGIYQVARAGFKNFNRKV